MTLTLTPTYLMSVFHAPEIVVDCGTPEAQDLERTACAAYLMWQVEYPDWAPHLSIPGRIIEERALNRALFKTRVSKGPAQ